MLALASVNKFFLTPRLPERTAMRGLQRNSLAEILLGLCVLGFVGMLGTLSPTAHTHATPVDQPPNVAFVHIHAPEAMAELTISPGRAATCPDDDSRNARGFHDVPGKGGAPSARTPDPGRPALELDAAVLGDGLWQVGGIPSWPGLDGEGHRYSATRNGPARRADRDRTLNGGGMC